MRSFHLAKVIILNSGKPKVGIAFDFMTVTPSTIQLLPALNQEFSTAFKTALHQLESSIRGNPKSDAHNEDNLNSLITHMNIKNKNKQKT